ncbi:hypothetical protein Tco_0829173 [Tanacetum coccineum]
MDGSSSQPYTKQLVSPIHSFPTEDVYEPQYSDSFQQTAREDSLVEVAAPPLKSKLTRGRQKRMTQNEEEPRCTAWTNEEEIALCKCLVHVSENSVVGNAKKECGFWTEVLRYMKSKTKAPGRRTYNMVNGKLKTVRPNMAWFCGVHANVMRRAHASGAGHEDYFATALLDYEAEYEVSFTLHHCWEALRKKSGDASINLNFDVGDDEEDEVQKLAQPIGRDKEKGLKKKWAGSSGSSSSMNDKTLASLMVSELVMYNKRAMERRTLSVFGDRNEGGENSQMEEIGVRIKAKWNLEY